MTTTAPPTPSLWDAIVARTAHALARGALQPIRTVERIVEDAGVAFILRQSSSVRHKEASSQAAAASGANPFLPYDTDLYVGDIGSTHVALLNKYPVIDHHLLVVTRSFSPQETLLDRADCFALARCLHEYEGLAFYNGGAGAGASQLHKHLQVVPLPLGGGTWDVPMEALFDTWSGGGPALRLTRLGFDHGFALLEPDIFDEPARAADVLLETYLAQIESVGAGTTDAGAAANEAPRQTLPYNLLVTRRWMLTVPRAQERFESISVNALGFAGSLYVRDDDALRRMEAVGPMAVLQAVARRAASGGGMGGQA